MATINQKFTGDGKQLEKEYLKLQKQQVQTEEKLRKVELAAARANKAQVEGSSKIAAAGKQAVANIKQMVAGYLGVQQAIQLVVGELKRKEELERRAAQTSMSVSDAEAQVAINIGDVSKAELQSFIGTVAGVREETGFQSQIPLLMAASTTLSATAGDQKLTADILRNVAPLFKSAPDDMVGAAQVVGDLAQLSETSAKETVGLVLSTMGQARVTSLQAFKNVAPAIAAGVATQQGVDPQQASRETAAAFAAIGNQIKDPEGGQTKTAVAALAAALERNFKDGGSLAQRLDLAQDLGERVTAGTASKEDLAIQKDLIKSGFEGATLPVIKQLLAGNDTKVAAAFDSALSKITFDQAMVDRKFEQLNTGTLNLDLAARSRGLSGQVEGAFLSGEAAREGFIRDQFNQAVETPSNIGFNKLNNFFDNMSLTLSSDKASTAITELESRITAVRRGTNSTIGQAFRSDRPDSELSEIDRNQIKAFEAAIKNIMEVSQRNSQSGSAAVQSRIQDERD